MSTHPDISLTQYLPTSTLSGQRLSERRQKGAHEKLAVIAEALVAKGMKQGFVTYEEVIELFPDTDEHSEISMLYTFLSSSKESR